MALSTSATLAGLLHAVNAADGKRLWTFKTEAEIKSSPVVAGDRVLIGSYDGNLYCLSARDGKLIWKFTTTNLRACHAGVSPRASSTWRGCDEVFHGIRLSDGQEVLQFPSGGYTGASVAMLSHWAYYGTSTMMLWPPISGRSGSCGAIKPARAVPVLLLGGGVRRPRGAGRPRQAGPLPERENGEAVWTFATRARVDSSPAIAGGRVYIGSNDGHFYVLDLASGKKLWDFEAGAPLSASPAIAEGRVVIGSQDGRLYCFGESTFAKQ